MRRRLATILTLFLSLTSLALPAFAGISPDGIWEDITITARSPLSGREPWIKPEVFGLFRLDEPSLAAVLNQAAAGTQYGASRAPQAALQLTLPAPDGQFITIVFTETPVMAPELAARFPSIKTYTGYLADDPTSTVAFDWTPAGFHAQVLSAEGAWYIDPYMPGESYASYYKRDYRPNKRFTDYPAIVAEGRTSLAERTPLEATPAKTDRVRKYRLALGCTAEYARYQCGGVCTDKTKPIAAMATTIVRVNQIYTREMAIAFELVADNDKLIYLDPLTQPFTNGNKDRLLEQSQKVVDREIGDTNYDMGHVISTSDGGLSMLGAVCQTGKKAMAITGLDQPKGDAYDVDFVCHEMGHSFNADHTYNSKLGLCTTDQYAPLMAYEPGSGSTIMSYCGQCDDDSIQFNGDPIFHSGNFDQIQTYMANKGGCFTLSQTANAAPVVQAGVDATIPRNTPFTLTGSATDADNDPLTYLWEEFDRGGVQASLSDADDGKMPLFRVYQPRPLIATLAMRTFPKMETIASGLADKTEKLPQVARTMNFRLTARDGKGGVAYGTRRIIVDGSSGPLRVTSPAAGATVPGGPLSPLTVTWDVANTQTLPGAATVDILLSTDGGYTFNPTALLAGAPNSGSAAVTLPDIGTERARIMVKASGNVFFAVSAGDFKINGTGGTLSVSPTLGLVSSGNKGGPFQSNSAVYTLRNTGNAPLDWTATKGAAWLDASPASGTLAAGANATVTFSINAAAAAALERDQYQDWVTFTNSTNGAGTTGRPVVLIVGQTLKDGMIVLEADGLDSWGFLNVGPFLPSTKTFTIRNAGMTAASWTATKTADWITLSPAEGTPEAGASQTVTATINETAAGKAAGSYSGTITFSRTLTEGSETVATRPVRLTIATPESVGTMAPAPAEGLASAGYAGGPFTPAGMSFTLRNVGQTALSWTAAKTADWLTLSPTGGDIAAGQSSVVSVSINSAAAALAASNYSDTLTFTNTTVGANGAGNTTRPVSLSIGTGPGFLAVTAPNPFTYTGPRGGPFTPAAGVTCTLQNSGGAAINWTVETLESWLEATPQQGALAAGASVTVTISAADMARALIAGTHKNTLYFSNKSTGTGSTTMEAQITVAATPATGPLTVSPASAVTVSGAKGGPFTPASFDFTLGNTGAETLNWEYMGDSGWATPPATTSGTLAANGGNAMFTVTMNGAANLLSSNNYRGSVYFLDKTHKMTVGRAIALKVKGPGDVTGDGTVNVADAVVSMQVKSGQAPSAVRGDYAASGADVDGDNKVGHSEAIYTMQAAAGLRPTTPYFILKSSAFRDEQPIPVKYMAHGLSPALSWSNAPSGTLSFVLIVEDPDEIPALGATKNYWIVYDIPATVTTLAEGAGAKAGDDGKNQLPAGAKHGTTSWDKHNTYYHGLEPTSNTGAHRFIFRLFALSVASISPVSGGTTQDKIEAAMDGKVLAGGICELMGTLSRP